MPQELPGLGLHKGEMAPLSTALAFLRESISPVRDSLRTSKYLSNQSHSPWREPMYSWVAMSSLTVEVCSPSLSLRAFSVAAFSPSLAVMDLESAARLAEESAIISSY